MSNEIVPNGTKVRYHGSVEDMHGEYTIDGLTNLTLRWDLSPEEVHEHWPDDIAYNLWPVGLPKKLGLRHLSLNSVRRQSFTVTEDQE